VDTTISEEHATSIFRAEMCKLGVRNKSPVWTKWNREQENLSFGRSTIVRGKLKCETLINELEECERKHNIF
jgi:hypothetical protein